MAPPYQNVLSLFCQKTFEMKSPEMPLFMPFFQTLSLSKCSYKGCGQKMNINQTQVGITADALVVLRSEPNLIKETKIRDPFASYFVTEGGRKFVEEASSIDPNYVEFNLARFQYITHRIEQLVPNFKQMIVPGSGYDTRPLWMPAFSKGDIHVYEIDQEDILLSKQVVLTQREISIPHWLHFLPQDLAARGLLSNLTENGFHKNEPTLVVMEGLIFFLPPELNQELLHPDFFGLSPGSIVIFDYWTNDRIQIKNSHLYPRLGRDLFSRLPFEGDPELFSLTLKRMGYSKVEILPIEQITSIFYPQMVETETPKAWFVVQATV